MAIPTDPSQIPNWNEDRAPEIVAVTSVAITVLSLSVCLRIYGQSFITNPLRKWDTWFTLLASILAIGLGACLINSAANYGLGKHTARVILQDPDAPDNLANIFMFGYIQITIQAACIMFTKLAILALYVRLFGMMGRDTLFTWGVYTLFAFTILLGIGSVIEFILQCIPAPVFWNRVYLLFPQKPAPGPTVGYCMPNPYYTIIPSILDLVSELAILLLPSKILWHLQLPLRKKIGLAVTFGLGTFVTLMNIIRIYYYSRITVGGDIAWDNIDAMIWTMVQMALAIVCACIPPAAPLLRFCLGDRESTVRRRYGSRLVSVRDKSTPIRSTTVPAGQSHELLTYGQSTRYIRSNSTGGESVQDLNAKMERSLDIESGRSRF
ncbi:hypothetical protein P280DRAFT_467634 [Massarina eburnea CBS 473.64]|uniref:Rhodopsin domain-containing protein n=1 Tax=Massarina eburnea CBS 473.64 TaxID=1395130 RepID=A0A6A6S3U6_9PLEO|nr:hypothetical protein P280DRAFT_467634 [Massarina eburnea CBS 473.64]